MKNLFVIAIMAIISMSSCAQDSKPAVKLTENEMKELLVPFFKQLEELPDDENTDRIVTESAIKFVNENKNDAGVYVVRAVLSQVMETEDLIKFVEGDEYLSNDSILKANMRSWKQKLATAPGNMFADFSATHNGVTTKLSDYVGKGKYVLVDFWASWCGPCKREIPYLIKAHEEFAGDKFTVLGVATWDKPEDTVKSIEALGINYPQMINAQYEGSTAYGIQGIPEIILFAPDGKILERGLRGDHIKEAILKYMDK